MKIFNARLYNCIKGVDKWIAFWYNEVITAPYEVEDYSPAILFGIFSVIFITPALYAPISGLLDRLHYYGKEGEEDI